jgi:hypothetical protein
MDVLSIFKVVALFCGAVLGMSRAGGMRWARLTIASWDLNREAVASFG